MRRLGSKDLTMFRGDQVRWCWILFCVIAACAQTPEAIVAGFEERVDAMFRSEAGKPLERARKNKPLGPGRGNYVRHYSWSMMEFAARCFYLGEMLPEANAALVENAQHYLDNPKDINDRDSFHWHGEMVLRLIETYGGKGLTAETEAMILKPIWQYVKLVSSLAKAEHETSRTWHIYQSENHHAMSFSLCWHFSKLAMTRPEYKDLKYDDGGSPAEHYQAWNEYFLVYCLERARKGLFIEMQNRSYNSCLLKGIYGFYDFGGPPQKRAAGMLLDLYWAYWAQEQIDGVQGGGRSRVYYHKGLKHNATGEGMQQPWLYFEIGEAARILSPSLNAALSGYRPPAVVVDIARDAAGRGRYEVRNWPLGLGETGRPLKTAVTQDPSKLEPEGGIQRYSYCDPSFIMGTPMTPARPLEDWVAISSQNRWQGVIFSGHPDARIVPIVRPRDERVALNAQWSVQSKGCLITQKLRGHKGGADMIVWLSGPSEQQEGIVFMEAPEAFAAVRIVGGFDWEGRIMIARDDFAPVILEVMAKGEVANFAAFKSRVLACKPRMDASWLHYRSVYGDSMSFDTSAESAPTVNGVPVNYSPRKAFESPFLNADWNSGVVTISKGDRHKVLDFTKPKTLPQNP